MKVEGTTRNRSCRCWVDGLSTDRQAKTRQSGPFIGTVIRFLPSRRVQLVKLFIEMMSTSGMGIARNRNETRAVQAIKAVRCT